MIATVLNAVPGKVELIPIPDSEPVQLGVADFSKKHNTDVHAEDFVEYVYLCDRPDGHHVLVIGEVGIRLTKEQMVELERFFKET
jgi:hypothetical protein